MRTSTTMFIGVLIGASFGLVFVVVNADSPLGSSAATLLRVLGIVIFIALIGSVTAARRLGRSKGVEGNIEADLVKKRAYWLTMGSEVALIVVGRLVIGALNAPQEANVAWMAFVVGLHFFGFIVLAGWPRRLAVPLLPLALFGLVGLAMSTTPAVAWVPLVSGVLSGFTLLAATLSNLLWQLARLRT